MDEGKLSSEDYNGSGGGRRKRSWLRIPLYMLAGIGVFAVAITVYAAFQRQARTEAEPDSVARITIDEAGTIEDVMTQTYGKYSESKRGWLYVGPDERTYVMKVIQQNKLPGGPEGEEMYFMASGAAVDGSEVAQLGAFHVRPNPKEPGALVAITVTNLHGGSSAVRPEDVQFLALSDKLWGWLLKVKDGRDPKEGLVSVSHVLLAPHGEEIVKLAEFPHSRIAAMEEDLCARGRETHEAFRQEAAQASNEETAEASSGEQDEMEPEETEPEMFDLCQERRYAYKLGDAKGGIPAPITVSVSGTLDGKKVADKTWKLVFDTKAFRYNVPDELDE
ncbi:hypothetical protein [uncultured Massilia sp.]|uniref:hypothetical protein n=1 Tax=uncultured Massilia sp. TaxID=169973 RepID=UPI0025843722|nr:hypothetical protein [uncultured Massilia sp.]